MSSFFTPEKFLGNILISRRPSISESIRSRSESGSGLGPLLSRRNGRDLRISSSSSSESECCSSDESSGNGSGMGGIIILIRSGDLCSRGMLRNSSWYPSG